MERTGERKRRVFGYGFSGYEAQCGCGVMRVQGRTMCVCRRWEGVALV